MWVHYSVSNSKAISWPEKDFFVLNHHREIVSEKGKGWVGNTGYSQQWCYFAVVIGKLNGNFKAIFFILMYLIANFISCTTCNFQQIVFRQNNLPLKLKVHVTLEGIWKVVANYN